ncbi:50S ribosomal protein L1 [Plectosphaerella plurivora]|uniref:50S ribosomal protein L1 n=1 Tax=Plectosphaerella plurivora TaxID=936078 RepID=A0A9P9ABA9_9PEZI|nr:50S ribosomal protein L1 [Plectosphaerella plurivora]
MATPYHCLASMARLSLRSASRPTLASTPRILVPAATQTRNAGGKNITKLREQKIKDKKKKKLSKDFKSYDPTKFPQFSLCDAVRYLRACEVGRPPQSIMYSLSVRLKTPRNGAVIKGRLRFPNNIRTTESRVAVICPDDSEIAVEALQAGAVIAGEKALLESIKNGEINFDKLFCHPNSEAALGKANLGRILGPKGLMPSKKLGTITHKITSAIQDSAGAEEYREKQGAIRLPIGPLGFSPRQLSQNVTAFIDNLKEEISHLEGYKKEIREVVLSTTNGPGFNLNGLVEPTDEKVTMAQLSHVM